MRKIFISPRIATIVVLLFTAKVKTFSYSKEIIFILLILFNTHR